MCACKEDQTATKVSEKSKRVVNCTKEWILDELKPDSKWRSPTFSSQAEGVRSLDWEIELRYLKEEYNYVFILYLLTDINDEIEVNHSFSLEEIDRVIFSNNTTTEKFHKCNKVGRSEPFSFIRLNPGLLEIKFQLSYVDSIRIRELDLEKSVMVLLGNLGNILVDPKFSDLTLCVKDREFKVHKAILAARSPVFAERFKQGLKDNKLDMGDDMDPDTVQEMLKFIYTGISPNLHKMAEKLLIQADYFELKTLKKKAEFELIGTISVANANELLVLADNCSASELKDKAEKFLAPDNAEFRKKSEKYLKDELPDYLGRLSMQRQKVPQSGFKKVKCSHVWESKGIWKVYDECSPKLFTEGTRSLDWKMCYYQTRKVTHPIVAYRFCLKLLTDLNEDLNINYSFKAERCDTNEMVIEEYSKTATFRRLDKTDVVLCCFEVDICSQPPKLNYGLKITCEFSCTEPICAGNETSSVVQIGASNADYCGTSDGFVVEKSISDSSCGIEDLVVEKSGSNNCGTEGFADEKSLREWTEKILQDPELCTDVTLFIKGTSGLDKEYHAHKVILSAYSTKFAEMFKPKQELFTNSTITNNRVEIYKDLLPDTVTEMLQFIYKGYIDKLTVGAQEQLLLAADVYDIKYLKTFANKLLSSITLTNALDLLDLANKCRAIELKKKVEEFIVKNQEKLEKTEEWKSMMDKNLTIMVPIMSKIIKEKNEPESESQIDLSATNEDEILQDNYKRLKGIDPKLIEQVENEMMDSGKPIGWEDIAGLEFAKKTIQEIVIWPMLRPDIFTKRRGLPKGLLLFGPPGTGKTLIGKCIASQSKSTFFSISSSTFNSRWKGEGEKMVRALFAVARSRQPAVVFIDEIDSLLTQRTELSENEDTRRIKTEFLVQVDGCNTNSEDRLLVVGATNRPWKLDDAVRRRLAKRLYIPLPNGPARTQIIRNLMAELKHSLLETDIENLCRLTEGYSGADMTNLCKEAAQGSIRTLRSLREIKTVRPEDVLVSYQDFVAALDQVKASVRTLDLELYEEWNREFGGGI